jgi:hypothetical protein
MRYVIQLNVSRDSDDDILYWSNDDGWVDLSSATVFSDAERRTLNLPDDDCQWVALPLLAIR